MQVYYLKWARRTRNALKVSPNYVHQITIINELYQIVTQTLAQPLCGYRCVTCTCAAPMCCYGMCVQGVHSTGLLQRPTQDLVIRVATLILPRTRLD